MRFATILAGVLALAGAVTPAFSQNRPTLLGASAFGDWRSDAPGIRRKITPEDMPAPMASASAGNFARVVPRPAEAALKAPAGFQVELFAGGLSEPRVVRVAPDGDVFVAESSAGRVRVFLSSEETSPPRTQVFASGLDRPFGIAFYPPGPDPKYVYVATTRQVVRYAYRSGDLTAGAPPEIVAALPPGGGHWTRDIAFSSDGRTMFVSVGSTSNIAESMPRRTGADLAALSSARPLGAAWGDEENRADVLAFDPDGAHMRIFATGLRNCSGLAVQPETSALWCVVNERDALGDDLPPDYATRVVEGAFYGWPWYYIGARQDPRHKDERPDLANEIAVPDVLIQPHSAPLGMTFYEGSQFPAAYRGDAFVALHGSWNRAKRTGYKVVRLIMKDGRPTGEYEDFLIGFVVDDARVWGRPVDVAVDRHGALLVTDDGGGAIWRVSYKPR